MNDIKKELNERISKEIANELKRNKVGAFSKSIRTNSDMIKTILNRNFLTETINQDTEEKDIKIISNFDLKEELNQRVKNKHSLSLSDNTDFKAFVIEEKDMDRIAKEINNIYNENKVKDNNIISEKILEYLEEKDIFNKSIEVNKEKFKKADDFEDKIYLIEKCLTTFGKENGTVYSGMMCQIDNKKDFALFLINKKTEEKTTIKAKNILEFKDKIVDFIENDIESKKDYYFKNQKYDIYKARKDEVENLREKAIFKEDEIKTNKDFLFEFNNKRENGEEANIYRLVIADDKEKYEQYRRYANFKNISFALTDENYSEYFSKTCRGYQEHYTKIDYLKEKNETLIEEINKNIEKETFEEAKADIIVMAVYETREKKSRDDERSYSEVFKESLEDYFNTRIGNLKEIEKFTEKNVNELGLTLNSNGKISELYSPDESKYRENVVDFFNVLKENIKEEIGDKLEFKLNEIEEKELLEREEKGEIIYKKEKEKIFFEKKNKVFNELEEKYLDKKPETLLLQNEFLKNAIPILLSEDKMGMSNNDIDKLSTLIDKKEELKDRVVNYFNSHSEHIKNVDNDFNFDLSISFPLGNYDKFTKEKDLLIEIPKEDLKKEVFEKELNEKELNEKEM